VKVSVVVITAREDPGFVTLAQSVQKSTHKDIELVVVDRLRDSRKGWTEACAQAGIPFIHLQDPITKVGPCPSAARNIGISAASGDYIICLDDLTTFHVNFVSIHLARVEMGFDAIAGSYIEFRSTGDGIHDPRTEDPYQDHGRWISQRFYGMHMGFTKNAWATIGGFDEAYDGAYGYEDCDFGRRLFRAGFSIGWFPDMKVNCNKDSRHHLGSLRVGKLYGGQALERNDNDEPCTILYGERKWKNDKLLLLNDAMQILDGGFRNEK